MNGESVFCNWAASDNVHCVHISTVPTQQEQRDKSAQYFFLKMDGWGSRVLNISLFFFKKPSLVNVHSVHIFSFMLLLLWCCCYAGAVCTFCSFYAAVVHMFSLEVITLKCELFRLKNTGSIMSRYNPVELIWAAMARAAARDYDDPGWIDIMDYFELPFAGYGSGDDVEGEDGQGGQVGERGQEGEGGQGGDEGQASQGGGGQS